MPIPPTPPNPPGGTPPNPWRFTLPGGDPDHTALVFADDSMAPEGLLLVDVQGRRVADPALAAGILLHPETSQLLWQLAGGGQ